MRFRVVIQPSALLDAEEYVKLIRDTNLEPIAAARWYDGLADAINSLESMPSRFSRVPEADSFKRPLRHLVYQSHRIVFHIDEESRTVSVLRVYHIARQALNQTDVE